MDIGFYKLLNVEKEERTRVNLLLMQSLFLGIFYGTLDISAHALFLSEYSEEMLPMAFLISGFVGIILTAIYTRLQAILSFSKLSIQNLLFVALIMAGLWFGFRHVGLRTWVFVVFVMMGPLNILALIGFGGTTNRLFSLREGKRLFSLVDAGQILGIIISSYAIPMVLTLGITTQDLLLFSALSVVCAFLFQLVIVRQFQAKDQDPKVESAEPEKKHRFADLFKDSYTFVMASFVGFSVIVAFLVHYGFIAVTYAQFPENTEFAQFFGYFMGTLMVFTLLFKTIVFSRLMKTYGLRLSLLISPILIAFFSIASAIVGGFFGYTTAAAGFTFFFLLIALTKLFSKSLKDSIEAPSFKILYLSLDKRIRYDMQAKIDGTVNEISAVAAGLIMAGLASMAFVKLIHFNYLLVVFVVVWLFSAIRLYRLYQKALKDSLAGMKESDEQEELIQTASEDYISFILKGIQKTAILTQYQIIQKWLPLETGRYVLKSLETITPGETDLLFEAITEEFDLDSYKALEPGLSKSSQRSGRELKDLETELNALSASWSNKNLNELLKISDPELKLKVLKFFRYKSIRFSDVEINAILRESDPRIRNQGLLIAGEQKTIDLIPAIIDLLSSDENYSYAFFAILEMGTTALDQLDRFFYKTGISTQSLKRIVRLMGYIGGEKSFEQLLGKIEYHIRPVVLETIKALKIADFQSDEESRSRFYSLIEQAVQIIGWNLAAKTNLIKDEISDELEIAINDELLMSYNFLYEVLSIAFDPQTIRHIRENLEHGSAEGVSFALELLDLVIDEEIKPVLLPVLNDISDEEKLKELQNFFALERMDTRTLLLAILNRDYNYLNLWTKVCALSNYAAQSPSELPNDLIAQIFHPDPVLRETATLLASHIDNNKLEQTLNRIPRNQKAGLEESLKHFEEKPFVLEEKKILNLMESDHFKSIKGHDILPIAKDLCVIDIEPGDTVKLNVWDPILDTFIMIQGQCELWEGSQPLKKYFGTMSFSLEMKYKDPKLYVPEGSPRSTVLYHIKGDRILEHFFDEPQNLCVYLNNRNPDHMEEAGNTNASDEEIRIINT